VTERIHTAGRTTTVVIKVPLAIRRRSGRKQIEVINPEGTAEPPQANQRQPRRHDPLTIAVARAHWWQELLDSGRYPSISALTRDLKVDFGYVSRLLQLTLLAPDIIEAILNGTAPSGVCLDKLQWRLPLLWDEQRQLLGFDSSAGSPARTRR
jgi:hypothetical protein